MMDFVVDTTRLPVGTIFFGYCTGKGQLGITEGPYENYHYPVRIWRGSWVPWFSFHTGDTEASEIDYVYRPQAGRASFLSDSPEGCGNKLLIDHISERFQSTLAVMKRKTGIDWAATAAEPTEVRLSDSDEDVE